MPNVVLQHATPEFAAACIDYGYWNHFRTGEIAMALQYSNIETLEHIVKNKLGYFGLNGTSFDSVVWPQGFDNLLILRHCIDDLKQLPLERMCVPLAKDPMNGTIAGGKTVVLHMAQRMKRLSNKLSLDTASEHGQVAVLDCITKQSGCEFDYSVKALDEATSNGHLDVLEWWRQSGLDLRVDTFSLTVSFDYPSMIENQAMIPTVKKWWNNSGQLWAVVQAAQVTSSRSECRCAL